MPHTPPLCPPHSTKSMPRRRAAACRALHFSNVGRCKSFARKNKIIDYFFGSLLTYSYLCKHVSKVKRATFRMRL